MTRSLVGLDYAFIAVFFAVMVGVGLFYARRSYVTGMDGFRVRNPITTSTVPLSKLVLDFNKCAFVVELYHCTSAQQFEIDENGVLVFPDLKTKNPKPADNTSHYKGSTISVLKDVLQKKYPDAKFSVVGSILGVSNGYPMHRGWPRPNGDIGRIEVAP